MRVLNDFLDAVGRLQALFAWMAISLVLCIPGQNGDSLMKLETQRMALWMEWSTPNLAPKSMQRRRRVAIAAFIGWLVILIICLSAIGCSNGNQTPTPITIETDIKTASNATPLPVQGVPEDVEPTPIPKTVAPTPDLEATITARVEAAMEARAQEAALTPTPEPLPVPVLTPTKAPTAAPTATREAPVRFVPVPSEAQSVLNLSSISINDYVLNVSGTLDGDEHQPTSIQVWESQDEQSTPDCSTDRPIAFIRPGNGSVVFTGLVSPYTWFFCRDGYDLGRFSDEVPWLQSQSWSYEKRPITYVTDPIIYDFSVSATLNHTLVRRLEYNWDLIAGWRVVVFSGENIILNQWVEKP